MMETFLSIASFSISVGGLVALFVVRGSKKEIVFGVIVAVLVATSGASLYSSYRHNKYIDRVQEKMVVILSEPMTFDDLYQNIYPPVPHEVLREALYDAIEDKAIGYRPLRVHVGNGKIISVKMFYARR